MSYPTRRSLVEDMLEVLPEGWTIDLEGLPFRKICNFNGCLKLDGEKQISLPHGAKKMPPYEVLDEIHTAVLFSTTIYGINYVHIR